MKKKLTLTTETLRVLHAPELSSVDGGRIPITYSGCEYTGCCGAAQSNSHCFAGC